MASNSKSGGDDGYSPPPIVEWLSFTVDQLRSIVSLFSTEIQAVLTEYVDNNLTDLLREDYKSAKISQKVVKELQEKISKVTANLAEVSGDAEDELVGRFPHLQLKTSKVPRNGIICTDPKSSKSRESDDEDREEVSGTGGRKSGKSEIKSNLNLEGSDVSSISDEENEVSKSSLVNGNASKSSGTRGSRSSEVDTQSETGSEDGASYVTKDKSKKGKEKSPVLGMEPLSDEEMETESVGPKEKKIEKSGEVGDEAGTEPPTDSVDLDLGGSFDSPASPAETVFFDAGKSKSKEHGSGSKSGQDNDISSKGKNLIEERQLLPPPSPPETVFLGPPKKKVNISASSSKESPVKVPLLPPPSPPETVFLGEPKRTDPEALARKQIMSGLLDDDDDDFEGPPSPTETVLLRKEKPGKTDVNAPFKLPSKVKPTVKTEKKYDSSDDERPGTSKAAKKEKLEKDEKSRSSDEREKPFTPYSYQDDPKLKPKACFVSLERLPSVILDRLRSHKTIDLSLYKDKSKGTSRTRRLEPEDEITKAIRRLANFNPRVNERDRSKHDSRASARSRRAKKKKSDDEEVGRDYDDATTEDSSESEPVLQRKIPPQQGMAKEDMVGSEDEDLDGIVSSSSEEDSARKNILKGAGKVKTEVSSDDDQKKAKKKKPAGESYYTPRVCHVPDEDSSDGSDSDDFVSKKSLRGNKKKSVIISDSDEGAKKSEEGSDDEVQEVSSDDSDVPAKKKTRRKARRRSTDSESDYQKTRKRRKRVKEVSDSDDSTTTKKKARKKVKKEVEEVDIASGSDSDVKEVSDDNTNKGRKKIRNIINKKDLHKATRVAELEEEKRKKRIAERQAQFNEMFQAPETAVVNSLVLDFNATTKEPLVSVDTKIVKKLKPHQLDGIRFLWNACFESVEEFKKQDNEGGGCILAHCMGLGKTLQTVAFLHTVMTSEQVGLKTALVICPLNTVGNWNNEFKMWLRDVDKRLFIHKLYDEKNNEARAHALETWQRRGGVGIINYECFRALVQGARLKKSTKKKIEIALIDPGPDIVVCDEGHLFKNAKSKLALAVNKIKTKRRVVLTGTPLQNNLLEYHCMMEFVKPKLLGTKKEFSNRFVNPITNGQHKDSTARDVSVMKKRAHVLHKLLDGCVQRLDYTVLLPYLPPKYEYVVLINLSEIQKKMYTYYLQSITESTSVQELIRSGQLLKHAANLAKVWSHPYALELKSANYNNGDTSSDSAGSLKDFIDDRSDCSESGSDSDIDWLDSESKSVKKNKTKVNPPVKAEAEAEVPKELSAQAIKEGGDWWNQFFKSKSELQQVENSSKLVVLFEILKTCEGIQDKVLVFSQYLYSLDIIESALEELDQVERNKNTQDTFPPKINTSRWRKNIEYFRIDGSTKSGDRQRSCDSFNKTDTSRAKLFLISTKAGGLGINLIGANRVVLFDASWNPSQDMQSIFRVFRFGQTKPCYIYRLLAKGTMEEKIYNRQVVKLSLAGRVVDEHQIERHFTFEDMAGMYKYEPEEKSDRPLPPVPKDRLLADLLISQKDKIDTYLEHDSLLQNKVDEGLTEEERKLAWDEYQNENLDREKRQQQSVQLMQEMQSSQKMKEKLRILYPHQTEMETHTLFLYVNRLIDDVKNSTNQFHYKQAGMSEPLKQQWMKVIDEKKARIQKLFQPNQRLQFGSNFIEPIGPAVPAEGAENTIRVANFNNILEMNAPTQSDFARFYNPNPNILNNRAYPGVNNQVRRGGIPTTTVPYSPDLIQQLGQLPQLNRVGSQLNPVLQRTNQVLPNAAPNPNF